MHSMPFVQAVQVRSVALGGIVLFRISCFAGPDLQDSLYKALF
jgi:hypothetical protein